MKIVVTGGAGFIGSHLVDGLIDEGHHVGIIDNLITGSKEKINKKAEFYDLDIKDEKIGEVFSEFKPEAVFHLAGQTSVKASLMNPSFDADENIYGTLNILEAAKKHNVGKFIFASSAAIYGYVKNLPVKEEEKTQPISFYGLSKSFSERYILMYQNLYSMPVAILRYSNVYGPRQNAKGEAGVIAIFIDKMLKEEILVIDGDGEQTRDFIYVKDVVRANIEALKKLNGIYNVGTSSEYSINKLRKMLESLENKKLNVKYGPVREGDIKRIYYSINKIQNDSVWKPETSLKEGLRETIQYYKER